VTEIKQHPNVANLPPGRESTAVVVTGASSGIGARIAVALAAAGTGHVFIHYRKNLVGAENTALAVRALGSQASLLQGDLSVPEDTERLVEQAWSGARVIQTWIHNAGADVLTGAAGKLDFQSKLELLWRVDVEGTIRLARKVAERMLTQTAADRPPSMVFIGWDQAMHGMEGDAGQLFGPTKAAVMSFAASLAQSLAPKIRVNTVAPGWIQTAWGESANGYWDERAKKQSMMGRWGQPEDVAAAVLYAVNPDHTFVTGQVLDVNGGWNRTF
jgi:3-oxoacyl-[acyl-carrier protein] reductase